MIVRQEKQYRNLFACYAKHFKYFIKSFNLTFLKAVYSILKKNLHSRVDNINMNQYVLRETSTHDPKITTSSVNHCGLGMYDCQ